LPVSAKVDKAEQGAGKNKVRNEEGSRRKKKDELGGCKGLEKFHAVKRDAGK